MKMFENGKFYRYNIVKSVKKRRYDTKIADEFDDTTTRCRVVAASIGIFQYRGEPTWCIKMQDSDGFGWTMMRREFDEVKFK